MTERPTMDAIAMLAGRSNLFFASNFRSILAISAWTGELLSVIDAFPSAPDTIISVFIIGVIMSGDFCRVCFNS